MSAKILYHPEIISLSQDTHYVGTIKNPTHTAEGYNKICGDFIKVYLKIHNDIIIDYKFTSECCAICKASAVKLGEQIINKSSQDVLNTKMKDFPIFKLLKELPSRIKCAELAISTTQSALNNISKKNTEDV